MKTQERQLAKIAGAIFWVRRARVMLDVDLAGLYGVETKYLKRQVNRNRERFPSDFMFTLTRKEVIGIRCQIGTLDKWGRGQHSKYLPYAFTEHGILMLSSVLNSSRAVQTNIAIMRAFLRLREMLSTDRELAHKFWSSSGK